MRREAIVDIPEDALIGDDEKKDREVLIEIPESLMTKAAMRSCYSVEQRMQMVYLATLLGNARRASLRMKIPYRTVAEWVHSDWWKEIENKLKMEASKELESKFTTLIRKALVIVENRMDQGDEVITKNGEIARKGVSGKDAALIICQLFDKRALLRGDPTSRTERTSTAKERLKNMARDMEKIAESPTPEDPAEAVKH